MPNLVIIILKLDLPKVVFKEEKMTKRQNIFKFFLALIVVSMLGLGIFLTIDPTRKAIHSSEINTEAADLPTATDTLRAGNALD